MAELSRRRQPIRRCYYSQRDNCSKVAMLNSKESLSRPNSMAATSELVARFEY